MATWAEVTSNPKYQQLPDDQKEAARNEYFDTVVKPKLKPDQVDAARSEFDKTTSRAANKAPAPGTPERAKEEENVGPAVARMLAQEVGDITTGKPLAETALHVASGIASLPVQAAGSVYGLVTAPPGLKAKTAAENAAAVGEAMTYQPRSLSGQAMSKGVDTVMGLVPKAADYVTGGIAENPTVKKIFGNTGGEVLQGLSNWSIQALATALGPKAIGKVTGAVRGAAAGAAETAASRAAANEAAVAKAKAFVENKSGVKWDDLTDDMKDKLTLVARHSPDLLEQVKPSSVARESRLQQLKVPATKGDIERNVAQKTHEETLSKGPQGEPIQNIRAAQDVRLHQLVDESRKQTGARAETRRQVGESVEGALRGAREEHPQKWGVSEIAKGLKSTAKQVWSKANYNRLYNIARKTEPEASVSAKPLVDMLEKEGGPRNPDIQHLGWLQSWLNKARIVEEAPKDEGPQLVDAKGKPFKEAPEGPQIRNVKLEELQDLRTRASEIARTPTKDAYYAGKVVEAIDAAMEKTPAAAKAWKAAQQAFKDHKIEFEDQRLVRDLSEMDSRTDPKTALEETGKAVRDASADEIRGLRRTLTEGGTAKTRNAGRQAWRDIRGSVIDYLREQANKKENVGAEDQQEFTAGFAHAVLELDRDGKLQALFGKEQAAQLRKVAQATRDVRTGPRKGVSGSDTAANEEAKAQREQLALLEKLEKAPDVGYGTGIVSKGAGFLKRRSQAKQTARDVESAKRSRLTEAATDAKARAERAEKSPRKAQNRRTLAGAAVASTHPMTLQEAEAVRNKQKEDARREEENDKREAEARRKTRREAEASQD